MKTICMTIFLFSPERSLPGKAALCHVACHWSTPGSRFIFIKNKMPPQNGVPVSLKAQWSCLVMQGQGFEISTIPICQKGSCGSRTLRLLWTSSRGMLAVGPDLSAAFSFQSLTNQHWPHPGALRSHVSPLRSYLNYAVLRISTCFL